MASRAADGPALSVVPVPYTWDEFMHRRQDWHLDRVAIALDSAEDRRFVQASLPRWTVNAWTQRDNVGISRHSDFSTGPCVCCLYMPDGEVPNYDQLVASALRFEDAELKLVREYLSTSRPLEAEMLLRVAKQLDRPVDMLMPFQGKTLDELYVRGVCGGMIMEFGDAAEPAGRIGEVPMAFQSALAGIMLAAEVFIDAAGLRSTPLPGRTEINLLKTVRGTLSSPQAKHSSGRCICQDPEFVEVYRAKYCG